MASTMSKTIYKIILVISIVFLMVCGCGKKKSSESVEKDTGQPVENMVESKSPEEKAQSEETGKASGGQVTGTQVDTTKSIPASSNVETTNQVETMQAASVSPGIQKLIDEAGYWDLAGKAFYGTSVPNISLTDISGKTHHITDYKGKNIIVFSFATWCPGCEAQVEFFKLLSKMYDQDKYVILGIAAKTPMDDIDMVKKYIGEKQISYPVIYLEPSTTPTPFNMNKLVPCSYFIGPEGRFKIGIEDIIRPKDLIRIMETP